MWQNSPSLVPVMCIFKRASKKYLWLQMWCWIEQQSTILLVLLSPTGRYIVRLAIEFTLSVLILNLSVSDLLLWLQLLTGWHLLLYLTLFFSGVDELGIKLCLSLGSSDMFMEVHVTGSAIQVKGTWRCWDFLKIICESLANGRRWCSWRRLFFQRPFLILVAEHSFYLDA